MIFMIAYIGILSNFEKKITRRQKTVDDKVRNYTFYHHNDQWQEKLLQEEERQERADEDASKKKEELTVKWLLFLIHRLEKEENTETQKSLAAPNVAHTSQGSKRQFSSSCFVVTISIIEMGDAQADVREDIFASGRPEIKFYRHGREIEERLQKQKRRKGASALEKSEQAVLKQRKDLQLSKY